MKQIAKEKARLNLIFLRVSPMLNSEGDHEVGPTSSTIGYSRLEPPQCLRTRWAIRWSLFRFISVFTQLLLPLAS